MKIQKDSVKTICNNCRNSTVVKLDNNETAIRCNDLGKWVSRPVIECSSWELKGSISIDLMHHMAWRIEKNKKGELGFRPPKDR